MGGNKHVPSFWLCHFTASGQIFRKITGIQCLGLWLVFPGTNIYVFADYSFTSNPDSS